MRAPIRRMVGVLMALLAVASLLVSLVGLVQVWRLRPHVTSRLLDVLSTFSSTLETSSRGLSTIDLSLMNLTVTVNILETTSVGMAQSIHDTSMLVDSLSALASEDLPEAITNAQTALASAQASAVVIDNILSALSNLPLIGLDYNPPVPLNQALGQVSTSLEPLHTSLSEIDNDLASANTNLLSLETQIIRVADQAELISQNLLTTQSIVDDYKGELIQLKQAVQRAQDSTPGWVRNMAWILSFVIVWLGISQLGLLSHGIEMARGE